MPPTHTADFQTAALKATDLDAVEKVNVGLETELLKKHVNIIADAPEIRIQDKTGSAPEVNATTMAIVADVGTTHFRAGTETFAEGTETKGNVKFQSSTGATTHARETVPRGFIDVLAPRRARVASVASRERSARTNLTTRGTTRGTTRTRARTTPWTPRR